MTVETFSQFSLGDLIVRYRLDKSSGRIGLELFPVVLETQLCPSDEIDPLVHVKIVGDSYSGLFAQGRTMRDAPTVAAFRFQYQSVNQDDTQTTVLTALESDRGVMIEHSLSWYEG